MKDDGQEAAANILNRMGFSVVRIPTSTGKTADLRAADNQDRYLIEVKCKRHGPSAADAPGGRPRAGTEPLLATSLQKTNCMSGIFDDAVKQLRTTKAMPNDFRIIWFMAEGSDPDSQIEQFVNAVYGTVPVLTPAGAILCYFFDFNAFYDAPDVDAVIAGTAEDASLCINTFATRPGFRSSKLYTHFAECNAVCDPKAIERAGQVFIADCGINRRDVVAMQSFLSHKYGLEQCVPLQITAYLARTHTTVPTR